jgi:hypothetical protein
LVSGDTFLRHDDMIQGFGLTIGEVQAVARRQFVGSVVVAFLVVTVAGFVALWLCTPPMLRDYATAHESRGVQQPAFVMSSDRLIATTKRATEVR